MVRFALLLLLGGCDVLFPLSATSIDAAPSCPNAVGHDEDGDGIDDACDNCPHIRNPLQEDTIEVTAQQPADGVGDACDPRPAVSGDRLYAFESFAGSDAAIRWDDPTRVWKIVGESLAYTGNQPEQTVFDIVDHEHVARFTAIFKLMVDSTPAGNAGIGIVIDADGSGHGIDCDLVHFAADGHSASHLQNDQPPTDATDGDTELPPLGDGQQLLLRFDYDNDVMKCAAAPSTGEPPSVANLSGTIVPPSGRIGFKGSDIPGHIDYIALYTR